MLFLKVLMQSHFLHLPEQYQYHSDYNKWNDPPHLKLLLLAFPIVHNGAYLKQKKKIQSSIPELTVGEERKLFNQIRKSAAYIESNTLLFNGWTAGGFALTYIIQHHMKRKRKAEEKTSMDESNKKMIIDVNFVGLIIASFYGYFIFGERFF